VTDIGVAIITGAMVAVGYAQAGDRTRSLPATADKLCASSRGEVVVSARGHALPHTVFRALCFRGPMIPAQPGRIAPRRREAVSADAPFHPVVDPTA
jgi:hypothetical protein